MALLEFDDVSIAYRTREAEVFAVNACPSRSMPARPWGWSANPVAGRARWRWRRWAVAPPGQSQHGAVRFEGRLSAMRRRAAPLALAAHGLRAPERSRLARAGPLDPPAVRDTAAAHGMRAAEADRRAAELLRRVELDPSVLDRFPHELSGGMRQRAIIALALLFRPPLLVADEPTTGLDVIVQRQIVNLLTDLRRSEGLSLLFISHDIGVVAELCDRVAVLYAGEVMEEGPTAEVLSRPSHPYTMGLAQSFPDIRAPDRPLGQHRRPSAQAYGRSKPARSRRVAPLCVICRATASKAGGRSRPLGCLPLLRRSRGYARGRGPAGHLGYGAAHEQARANRGLSRCAQALHAASAMFGEAARQGRGRCQLRRRSGRVLGIAGESGSGKSTLANLLVGLERPTAGEIVVDGLVMGAKADAGWRRSADGVPGPLRLAQSALHDWPHRRGAAADPRRRHAARNAVSRHRRARKGRVAAGPSLPRPLSA